MANNYPQSMQEIANGTYNYQLLNEIMPMIYKRFTEKTAEEWRQIYKALQLLEFLVKNGSERVIDDARSHLTLLKMLRQFHYIDQNGKDQGINVRNRAKELTDLLSDVERIRAERKKSRATRQKYTGVEGGAGIGGSSSMGSSSRYGGFSSEDMRSGGGGQGEYGGYSGGVFGDGGGFGGQSSSDFQDTGNRAEKFEEYDEYDDGGAVHPGRKGASSGGASSSSRPRAGVERTTATAKAKTAAPPKPKAPEVDLFSFDDPTPTSSAPAAMPSSSNTNDTDDDFDDFQSAPSAPPQNKLLAALQSPVPATTSTTNSFTQFASPQPVSAPKQADLSSMMGAHAISPAPSTTATPVNYSAFAPPMQANKAAAPVQPTGYTGGQPNYFTSVKVPASAPAAAGGAAMGVSGPAAAKPKTAAAGGDVFGNLWQTASAGVKKTATPTQGPALGQLAKEKASAGIWGAGATAQPQGSSQPPKTGSSGLDDLLG